MPKREAEYDYFDELDKNGNVRKTLDRKLYAPDGSIFRMPFGGNPVKYLDRGFRFKPNAEWQEKHEAWKEAQAESKKRSDFQRESKNRVAALAQKEQDILLRKDMAELDAKIQAEEARLASLEASIGEVSDEPEAPKAKRGPGRPKKVEA